MAHSSLQGKRFKHAGTGIDWKLCERNWKAEATQREREELGGKIIFLGQNVQNLTFHIVSQCILSLRASVSHALSVSVV